MKARLTAVFANEDEIGFIIGWNNPEIGFGQLRVWVDRQGKDYALHMDTETMGKDFAKDVLSALVDRADLLE